MDDLTCLGCGCSFASQKKLCSHEPQCEAHDEYTADIFRSQQHLQKGCKEQRAFVHQSVAPDAEYGDDGLAVMLDADIDMQPAPTEELQVFTRLMERYSNMQHQYQVSPALSSSHIPEIGPPMADNTGSIPVVSARMQYPSSQMLHRLSPSI